MSLRSIAPSILSAIFTLLLLSARVEASPVEDGLKAYLKGTLAPDELSLTCDDIHGLWGGIRIAIHGTGHVDQEAVRQKVRPPRDLNRADLDGLVRLVIELKAWEQRTPDRAPVPDESRAYLRIRASGARSEIWEWHNDMKTNNRLIRVLELMKHLVWEPNP